MNPAFLFSWSVPKPPYRYRDEPWNWPAGVGWYALCEGRVVVAHPSLRERVHELARWAAAVRDALECPNPNLLVGYPMRVATGDERGSVPTFGLWRDRLGGQSCRTP
jgi:hypothetical protein